MKKTGKIFALLMAVLLAAGSLCAPVCATASEEGTLTFAPSGTEMEEEEAGIPLSFETETGEEQEDPAAKYPGLEEPADLEEDPAAETFGVEETGFSGGDPAAKYPGLEEPGFIDTDPGADPQDPFLECLLTLDAGKEGFFTDESFGRVQTIVVPAVKGDLWHKIMETLPVPEAEGGEIFLGWTFEQDGTEPVPVPAFPQDAAGAGSAASDFSVLEEEADPAAGNGLLQAEEGLPVPEGTGTVTEDTTLYAVWGKEDGLTGGDLMDGAFRGDLVDRQPDEVPGADLTDGAFRGDFVDRRPDEVPGADLTDGDSGADLADGKPEDAFALLQTDTRFFTEEDAEAEGARHGTEEENGTDGESRTEEKTGTEDQPGMEERNEAEDTIGMNDKTGSEFTIRMNDKTGTEDMIGMNDETETEDTIGMDDETGEEDKTGTEGRAGTEDEGGTASGASGGAEAGTASGGASGSGTGGADSGVKDEDRESGETGAQDPAALVITFDANGGEFPDGTQTRVQSLQKGDKVRIYDCEEPVRDGFSFEGWSTAPDGRDVIGRRSKFPGTHFDGTSASVYAVWTELATVTFDAVGGQFADGSQTYTKTVEKGSRIWLEDLYRKDPSKAGCDFEGWSFSQESGGENDLIERRVEVTGDLVVYAVWTEYVTVTFDANGGYFGRGKRKKSTMQEFFEKGEEVDLKDYEPRAAGAGLFAGWSLRADGEILPSDRYTVQEEVTFFAVWSRNLRDASVTLEADSVVYNGKAQTPAVTVVYDDDLLTEGTDYTVSYSSNKNAGKASVTVKGKGSYKGTVKKTFTIRKAEQTLTAQAAASAVAVGKTTTVKVSGAKETGGYTWKSSNTKVASVSSKGKVSAKKVGTVKIKATAAATDNYKAASVTVTIKVVPAAAKKLTAKNLRGGILLTWTKVDGAGGYLLFRDGKKIAEITKGTTVTYMDKGANVRSRKYVYKLVAKASTGLSTLARAIAVTRKVPKKDSAGKTYSSSGTSAGNTSGTTPKPSTGTSSGAGSGTSSGSSGTPSGTSSGSTGTSSGTSSGSSGTPSGTSSGSAGTTITDGAVTGVRYCLEKKYVARTLDSCRENDLAVIDMDGISQSVISGARNRGVQIYGYLNAGALEQDRSYYNTYKNLRIAEYDGWEGEYWVDVTSRDWTAHLVEEARRMKEAGAGGVYLDNADILYMVETGFRAEKTKMLRTAPSSGEVYRALRDVVNTIQDTVGIIVMPNGGDTFVRKFAAECPGVLQTVNQECVLYLDFKAQPASERKYYTEYLDWCRSRGIRVRGIEYTDSAENAQKCIEYYREHGWEDLYISRHKNLEGD